MKTLRLIAQALVAVVITLVLAAACEKDKDELTQDGGTLKSAWGADTLVPGDSTFYGDTVFYWDTVSYNDSVYWGDSTNWNDPGTGYDTVIYGDSVIWGVPPVNPFDSGSSDVPIIPGDSLVKK